MFFLKQDVNCILLLDKL